MNLLDHITQSLSSYIQATFAVDPLSNGHAECALNTDEAKQAFGDISTNVAMVLAKQLKRNPRDVATTIVQGFSDPMVARIELAGPGFLNIFLTNEAFNTLAIELFTQKESFFKLPNHVPREHINIEFVSANPTGPLHLGHGRGGIIGDVLANVMKYIGHEVTKEFYINDAGSQITKLGISLKVRCQQACDMDVPLPEDGYAGDYLVDLAKKCIQEYGVAVLGENNSFFQEYAKEHLLTQIKQTLRNYGITFDVWFSERSLHTNGSIDTTLAILKEHGYLYEQEGALWFNSTAFGDDKDRVMKKSSGELTYVAADAAYLRNKAERGFDRLIMILGHDHHGYVQRLEGLRLALGIKAQLNAVLYQLVKMKAEGKQVRMSKRAGTIVTLEGVIEEVGTDVARFFYLNRKADAQLEFDLDLALTKTEENPVYYVQYAYVRTRSIFAKAHHEPELTNIDLSDIQFLTSDDDKLMLKKIASLKPLLANIAHNHQTHLLSYYVIELAQSFHRYYSKHRIIDQSAVKQSRGRLVLVKLLGETFERCLTLLGVECPEKM